MGGGEPPLLGRRIRSFTDQPSEGNDWSVREFYYNASWQLLEVRQEAKARTGDPLSEPALAAHVHEQYVWDLRYIDACVLRDRDSDSNGGTGSLGKTGSGLDERLYYLQDANFNVTAVVQGTPNHQDIGKVVERYAYDPYGRATVLDGETATDWAVDSGGSDWDNRVLFCGYRFDAETGLYHVRRRMYHSTYGRWLQRDPLGYVDGMGLYAYCGGRPCVASDPSGEILRVKFRNEPNRRYIEKLLQKMDPRVRVDSQGGVSIASTDRPKEGGGSGSLDGGLLEDLIRSDHTHTIQTGSGRSRCDATDPAGALDPNRGSGSTITLNPDDRTLLPRKMADGSTQSAQSTDYEKMEHEVIHAVHYDEGGVVEGDIAYSDLECTDRSAPAEEVRTIGCSGEPITGTKLSDITANDLIRARNRREGKADIEEGVYVGVGKEVRRW